jgi:ABC-type multidrug transport system fused ATPase/permease subunit
MAGGRMTPEVIMQTIWFGGMPVIVFACMVAYRIWPEYDFLELNSGFTNDSALIGYFVVLMFWPLVFTILLFFGAFFFSFKGLWYLSGVIVPKRKDEDEVE